MLNYVFTRNCNFSFLLFIVKSFNELGRGLLRQYPGKFLLSEKFSQDTLEQHFGIHRRGGGCSDNPQLDVFMRQEVALGVVNSDLISNFTGNTRGRPDNRPPIDIKDTRLPMKKKKTS